ncbi:hypothetical protein AMAG_11734 [Allomyces macrogynus ATCC 38327]|uniref:INO80 complex subunit B-like conserved region domain-containing protein n=1 Tax=Allomyces macrogynus (strain ATCC 38327) TaxID=578462 RepID=A0A0L0SVS3_ALLM3|nr:hypothetical protein AMAG_11734 [Allomyces macrogynus ATCC 38327]|eukprot:KNE66617.1 hypothetical protein AMAG_11734 [Allomyces macrogynus ATCC 38327]
MDDDDFLQHLMHENERRESQFRATARQRAARRGPVAAEQPDLDDVLTSRTSRSKKPEMSSEELALKRSEALRRRKIQEQQKAEDSKNATIQRLLKKQASKKSRAELAEERRQEAAAAAATAENDAAIALDPALATVRYLARTELDAVGVPHVAAVVLVPHGVDMGCVFPGAVRPPPRPHVAAECEATGCGKPRKYTLEVPVVGGEEKARRAACSLECYKVLRAAVG